MALTTDNTGAVLTGRPNPPEVTMKTAKVRALRSFYYNRILHVSGAIIELPAIFAAEMIAANKAESMPDVAPKTKPSESAPEAGGKSDKPSAPAGRAPENSSAKDKKS